MKKGSKKRTMIKQTTGHKSMRMKHKKIEIEKSKMKINSET